MRYVALVLLMVLITAILMRIFNKREYDFLECLFFSFSLHVITNVLVMFIYVFVKYW